MFYAIKNTFATETSRGFANTAYIRGFVSQQERDDHVSTASDLVTRAATLKEALKVANSALVYGPSGCPAVGDLPQYEVPLRGKRVLHAV